jgi:stress-induced morphogen
LAVDEEEKAKKEKSFLVRVESDVFEHFKKVAAQRRVAVAQVLRELIYEEFNRSKGDGNG